MKGYGSYTWLLGFLGFTGFLGITGEPLFLLQFAFFGFFSIYWWNKFDSLDERLFRNRDRAAYLIFPWALILVFLSSVLAGFFFSDPATLYRIELLIIALGFGVSADIWAYLTYRYDRAGS